MILIGVKLALRPSELIYLGFHSLIEDVCVVNQNKVVDGIGLKICNGKSDRAPVTLMLWADHEIPALCPVRHLLAWIAATGIESGGFFPTKSMLCEIRDLRAKADLTPVKSWYRWKICCSVIAKNLLYVLCL